MPDMDRRGWHIDKGVGIAHIISTVFIIVSGLWYLAGQDKRIAVLEVGLLNIKQSISSDQQRSEKKFDELKTDLRLINSKLDRLIESDR